MIVTAMRHSHNVTQAHDRAAAKIQQSWRRAKAKSLLNPLHNVVNWAVRERKHEQQRELDIAQDSASMLEVAVGDHLLLPQGQRLVLCKVRTVESRYVTVQYYSRLPDAKPAKPGVVDCQELTWWRQNPKKTEEDIEKLTVPFLTKAQVKKGFGLSACWSLVA